jgi:peptidoglycan-N-acetylmuramic acid deacetylase
MKPHLPLSLGHRPVSRVRRVLSAIALGILLLVGGCQPTVPSRSAPIAPVSPPAAAPVSPAAAPVPAKPRPPKPKPVVRQAPPADSCPSDNALLAWNFQRNKKHVVPSIPTKARKLAKQYGALYVGADPKVVYLTFDEGYESGNTPAILDTLKKKGVKATFFVTRAYVKEAPKLVRRMVAEGHVVGNHSATHPSMPGLAYDKAAFDSQLKRTADAYRQVTGRKIATLFRPPMGEYSARTLCMTKDLGYTTVFWSFAHDDYDEKNQPPIATTIARILDGSHPGALYLLHGMSSSDTQALGSSIEGLRKQGYGFGVLVPGTPTP